MKRFEIPMMKVVHLSGEDLIRASVCYGVSCPNFECPDCITCPNTFACVSLTCDVYGG